MKREKLATVFFAAVMVLGMAGSAGAVDGVIEINQAKVLAAGGFPFVIANPGSYRLTSNLTVPAGKLGIQDDSSSATAGVTIDLNGFSIIGPGTSSGGAGIFDSPAAPMTVENGTVTGFRATDAVGVDTNGFYTIVKNVQAENNSIGIIAAGFSLIEGCTANQNSVSGIQCNGGDCTISGNVASGNGPDGIFCLDNGCTISGNTANGNTGQGIECGNGCQISGNTANSNAVGIKCDGAGCLITGNTIDNNSGDAISASDATTAYGGNVMNGDAGISGGTSMAGKNTNSCGGPAC
jgi:parallel beta-helix repeat protein